MKEQILRTIKIKVTPEQMKRLLRQARRFDMSVPDYIWAGAESLLMCDEDDDDRLAARVERSRGVEL